MHLLLTKLDVQDMHGKVEVQRLLFEFTSNVENKNAFFLKTASHLLVCYWIFEIAVLNISSYCNVL